MPEIEFGRRGKNLSEIPAPRSFPKFVIILDCFPAELEVTLPNVYLVPLPEKDILEYLAPGPTIRDSAVSPTKVWGHEISLTQ